MPSNNKVFISAPISTDWSTVTKFFQSVQNAGGEPVYWDRNTRYVQKDFDSCGSVVFILPNNKFARSQYGLPIGLKNELSRAFEMNKDIYVGYITSQGLHCIYRASTDGKDITGVSGTTYSLKRALEPIKAAEKIATNSRYGLKDVDIDNYLAGKWGELEHPGNPCAEIKLPTARRVYATAISLETNWVDERLLLML